MKHAVLTACVLLIASPGATAWNADGHAAVGILAVSRMQGEPRRQLQGILGSLQDPVLDAACNWPDKMRNTPEWQWSAPQHYVNIPRHQRYRPERDCPEEMCLTEAVKRYAAGLGDSGAGEEARRQSFAWLCHLVGDLHQPLHAGFAHDRGGNTVFVEYRGQSMDLHEFWDGALIERHAGGVQELLGILGEGGLPAPAAGWQPGSVDHWTDESHQLAADDAYPGKKAIGENFELRSWETVQWQLDLAAARLALVLNTVLTDEE